MLVVRALRTAWNWRLLLLLMAIQLISALLPALGAALLLGRYLPVEGGRPSGLDLFLALRLEPTAWGDWAAAARFFGPEGMEQFDALLASGTLLTLLTWQALVFLLLFTLLWPGVVRLLAGRQGFGEAIQRSALAVLAVTAVQWLVYFGIHRLLLTGWGRAMRTTVQESPTEFLAILLTAGRLLVFAAVMLFLKFVFDFLKVGLTLEEERNPFKLLPHALLTALRHFPRLAGIFFLFGGFGILAVLAGGFNIVTLFLRDVLLLAMWAAMVEVWTPQ